MYTQLKKLAVLLTISGTIGTTSAQAVLKVAGNLTTLNKGTALEVESTTKGFLLPRMTKAQRDAIVAPPAGLQVWCTDCNVLTTPATGEFCIYSGTGWPPLTVITTPKVTTGKKSDPNAPVRLSAASVTINGVLVSTAGIVPTETGIVWKEIVGTDFGTLPLLDGNGMAVAPVYKTVGQLVTTDGGIISVTIPSLISTTSGTRPYYFSAYAKSASGIGYGNAVIFNFTPPTITSPAVIYQTGSTAFAGTLKINAGTPQGTITEYGYCTSTTNPPDVTSNKVVSSTATSLATLNTTLNTEIFTTDPLVNLAVNDYTVVTTGTSYFRYYVIANGNIIYSPVLSFIPVIGNPVTGGTAVATMTGVDPISAPLKISAVSSSTITVHFNVTQAGTYGSFIPATPSGATTGLSIPVIAAGNFALGAQSLTFSVNGTPATSFDGNSFSVPRIGTLSTGTIQSGDMTGGNALCDGLHNTTVVPVTSVTGRTWMDRNLGASRVALSYNDYQAYGGLYQWGRGNDGHASITWTSATTGTPVNGTTTTLSTTDTPGNNLFIAATHGSPPFDWRSPQNNMRWQGVTGINNPCPGGYRLPTDLEFSNEMKAYNMTNPATAYGSALKMVFASYRDEYSGQVGAASSDGYYWNSTVINGGGGCLHFGNNTNFLDIASGASVRCIQN